MLENNRDPDFGKELALQRLARAVERLEHTAQAAVDRDGSMAGEQDNATRAETAELRQACDAIAQRLDTAIARLHAALDMQADHG